MKPRRLWKINKPKKVPPGIKTGWYLFYFYLKSQDWKTIAWCLAVATVFWLFNTLSHQHTATIYFRPVPLLPKSDSTLVNIAPEHEKIGVNVTAEGWKLLPQYLNLETEQIGIPIESIGQKKLVTSQQIVQLIGEAHPEFKVNFVLKDSFSYNFQYFVSKELTVQLPAPNIWISPGALIIKEPQITPKTIKVQGAEPFLNLISDTIEIQVPMSNISQNFEGGMPLKIPDVPHLSFSQKEVKVSFEVVKVKRVEFVFSIKWKNIPKDTKVEISPGFGLIKAAYREEDTIDAGRYESITLDFNDINLQTMSIKPTIFLQDEALVFKVLPAAFKVKITEKSTLVK